MKQYDLIFWGRDNGQKHRARDPIVIRLEKPLYQGQVLKEGDIPELDAVEPRFPVTVNDIKLAESAESERAFHISEGRPIPSATVGK